MGCEGGRETQGYFHGSQIGVRSSLRPSPLGAVPVKRLDLLSALHPLGAHRTTFDSQWSCRGSGKPVQTV